MTPQGLWPQTEMGLSLPGCRTERLADTTRVPELISFYLVTSGCQVRNILAQRPTASLS